MAYKLRFLTVVIGLFIVMTNAHADQNLILSALTLDSIKGVASGQKIDHLPLVDFLNSLLEKEKELSQIPGSFFSLATVDADGSPANRILALRQLRPDGLVFFTQKPSRKVAVLAENNMVAANFWLPSLGVQINIRGPAQALAAEENHTYWATYPRSSQIRFLTYGPLSGSVVPAGTELDENLAVNEKRWQDAGPIPCPQSYVGYRVSLGEVEVYQLNTARLSDSLRFLGEEQGWRILRLVP